MFYLLKGSNYVAKIWKSWVSTRYDCPEAYEHDCNVDFNIKPTETVFPENVEKLLVQDNKSSFDEKFENIEALRIGEKSDDEEDVLPEY